MKSLRLFLATLICFVISINVSAQGLKTFKLPNGLSVFVWEDNSMPNVFGTVAVNAGSVNDPEDFTGLAHYLEHMLFKGTDKIGTLDWEKEKPIYDKIIAKYDERASLTNPAQRDSISKEINQLTQEAAKYNLSYDFSSLVQSIGGTGLNAGTNYDHTTYFNSFPPGELYKWLHLYSERLIHPVFRGFQQELETVYEEYNLYQDQQSARISEFILGVIFQGSPYARPIIGWPDHLKNPQLSQLKLFYDSWYVPENMALILVGNLNTNSIIPLIKETFGRLEKKSTPPRKEIKVNPVKGRKEINEKISRIPQVLLSFPGITFANEDFIALDICLSVLSNSSRTGLVDKLVLNGDLMSASAGAGTFTRAGNIQVSAVPFYDSNQRRFESLKSTENTLLAQIKNLQQGKFDENLVMSIKSEMIRNFDLQIESPTDRADLIATTFLGGRDMHFILDYKDLVMEVTTEQIKDIAKKYFGSDYYAIYLNEGKPAKAKELEKPNLKPITPMRGVASPYSQEFQFLPIQHSKPVFANINDVQVSKINELSKLFYTKNPENEIFTLTLKFGIGTAKMPKLGMAASLMNNAGIMGLMDAQGVKQEFSNLGAACRYAVSDDYFYVTMDGFEQNLEESCKLLMRQVLMPQLDDKQLGNLQGRYFQSRKMEKTISESLSDATLEYLLYQNKSDYIDRLSLTEISDLTVSDLTGEFQRATDYEAEIHYVGSLPLEKVYDILSKNLPLKLNEKATSSPTVKDRVKYTENTVYFLPDADAQQSSIYFFIEGDEYKKEKDPYIAAFNQYFSGGFSSIVKQEIREYRSMAYDATGLYSRPAIENKNAHFLGHIGTQADKTMDAISVFMDLLNNMPQYPDRINNLKTYLKETALVDRPHFRSASQVYQNWKLRGYTTQSPAEVNLPAYENLTFDDIVKFYEANIKGRPIAICVVGNPKMIDTKDLEKYGKVTKLSTSKVFSDK